MRDFNDEVGGFRSNKGRRSRRESSLYENEDKKEMKKPQREGGNFESNSETMSSFRSITSSDVHTKRLLDDEQNQNSLPLSLRPDTVKMITGNTDEDTTLGSRLESTAVPQILNQEDKNVIEDTPSGKNILQRRRRNHKRKTSQKLSSFVPINSQDDKEERDTPPHIDVEDLESTHIMQDTKECPIDDTAVRLPSSDIEDVTGEEHEHQLKVSQVEKRGDKNVIEDASSSSPSQDNIDTSQQNIVEGINPAEVRKEAGQEELERQSQGEEVSSKLDGGNSQKESSYDIDQLKSEVERTRAFWVETDVKNTTAWRKFKSLFGIEQDARKDETQVAYETALKNLRNAEITRLYTQKDGNGQDMMTAEGIQQEIERMLRYYKLDESVNLINARTEYKAEHQTLGGKMMDTLGALGRAYNRIPLKHKLILTGALAGITIGTTLSGGTAIGAMASVALLRKLVSGAGTAVGVEALLESFGSRKRTSSAEKEIKTQTEMIQKGKNPEEIYDSLNTLLNRDIASLGVKLENEKRAKTWRKLSSVGVGGLVGSGWLTQVAMNHMGGNEAVDWVKNQFGTSASESKISAVVTPVEKPSVPLKPDAVSEMIGKDYVVQKGDSVWKIGGRVADTLGLQGAEKTHFIDALKDKYGDVQLKAGEKIDFSAHGIDKGFVENALSHTKALSPDQVASITANDVKIAEYIASHPGTTLDNAVVDQILRGETLLQADAVTMSDGTVFQTADTIATEVPNMREGIEQITESPVDDAVPVESPALSSEPIFTAELTPRVNDWYMQIFRVENPALGQDWIVDKKEMGAIKLMDVFKDAKLYQSGSFTGYKTGLSPEQVKNFTQFFQGVEDNKIVFDRMAFLREHPNVTVMDYLKKIATLVTPGQRLGLYTTTH